MAPSFVVEAKWDFACTVGYDDFGAISIFIWYISFGLWLSSVFFHFSWIWQLAQCSLWLQFYFSLGNARDLCTVFVARISNGYSTSNTKMILIRFKDSFFFKKKNHWFKNFIMISRRQSLARLFQCWKPGNIREDRAWTSEYERIVGRMDSWSFFQIPQLNAWRSS